MTWLLVAAGAAVGAPCRYLADLVLTTRLGSRLPWGTLAVNVLGSAVFGVLAGQATPRGSAALVALVGTGFCGAFTTASTLAWEVVVLAESRRSRAAAGYLLLSVVVCVAVACGGLAVGRAV
jgi:CrcB protein